MAARPLSKSEAADFLSGSPAIVTPPLSAAQRPPTPHIPVSPPRMGAAAAARQPPQQQPEREVAAAAKGSAPAGAAPAAAAAPAAVPAAQNGKAPAGIPSRVLRLANMVHFHPLQSFCLALPGTLASTICWTFNSGETSTGWGAVLCRSLEMSCCLTTSTMTS